MSEEKKNIKKKNRLFRFLYLILGVLIILFVALYIALHINAVQNWAVDYVANRLSDKYNTAISVDRIDIDFTNHLILDGLYIEDHHQDTLVYVKHFKTDLARSIWTAISNEMYIDEVSLDEAVIHLRTLKGEQYSNFEQVFSANDQSTDEVKESNPWNLKISKFYASNVLIDQLDENKGSYYRGDVPQGSIIINPNSSSGIWEIKNIDLQSPSILMENWVVNDPVVDALQNNNDDLVSDPKQAGSTEHKIRIRDIQIREGSFSKINKDKLNSTHSVDGHFDPDNIKLDNVSLNIKDAVFENGELSFIPLNIAAKSESGFVLEKFSADKIELLKKKIKISNFYLKTGGSLIRRDVELSFSDYSDFNRFEDKVYMRFDANKSRIALDEIIHFVPGMKKSLFINQNRDMVASIDGTITGRVNNLTIKDLTLNIGNDIYLVGDFKARDITDPSRTLLNLELDHFESDIITIKKLIPNFNPTEQIQRLGHFTFTGKFDGFYKDFVADGKLITDIGSADIDMRMDVEQGRGGARYSGKLLLHEFNLGKWTSNDEFGLISGRAEVKDGYSLLPEKAKANLSANVTSMQFRGYNYRDLQFNGLIESGQLDGSINMDDENLAFDFAGSLTYGDRKPLYNFSAHIDRIDLQELNLSKRPLVISGLIDMDATDLNLNTIDGDVSVRDWTLQIDDTLKYYFDALDIHSIYHEANSKSLEVRSDILDLDINGLFILDKLDASFLKMIQASFPEYYNRLKLPQRNFEGLENQNFDFAIDVKDSKNLFSMIDNFPIDTVRDFKLKGKYNSFEDTFSLDGSSPKLTLDNVSIHGLSLMSDHVDGMLKSTIITDSLYFDDKFRLRSLRMDNELAQDTMNFRIKTAQFSDVLKNLNIGGVFYLEGDNYGLSFNSSDLVVLDEKWEISKENKIIFNKNFIRTSDLFASNGTQFLYVNSIEDKGLEIGAEYFDVDIVNTLWDYDKLDFRGDFELFVRTEDVFNLTDFQSDLHLDSLFINGDHYGEFMLDMRMNGVKMPIRAALNIVDDDKYLSAVGMVTPQGFGKPQSPKTLVDMEVYLEDYPAEIIEYWLGDGIENTKGIVDAELKLKGPIERIDMSGIGHVQDAETKVVFLGTTYKMADMDIPISNSLIDLNGGELIDRYGNRASVIGGITHDKMTDLRLDIELESDHFLALNTTAKTGESFYGHALGKMKVNFDGSVDAPNIKVVGVTGDSTQIYLPLEEAKGLVENNFVVFDHDTLAVSDIDIEDRFKVSGINFSMDLLVKDNAEMYVIMDELGENVMTGVGEGNLSIFMNRSGDFNVYGTYVIQEGSYQYSFENTIKREFDVVKGGTVTWSGHPFNAEIDLNAEFSTSTGITPFVEEFLGPKNSPDPRHINLRKEAQKNRRVKVLLSVTGFLLEPEINFDLAFLSLPSGELGNSINTKLTTLQADQNLLNRQAFSLLIFGQFLPEDIGLGEAVATSENLTNTVSEFVSYQLSKFVSEILRDAVTNASFISDFGLTIDYQKNIDFQGSNDDVFLVNPEFELFDGKLNLSSEASYVTGLNGEYFANDVVLQFSLNKSKRLRAKLFQKSDYELGNRKIEIGAGISYQRDFDKFFFQKDEHEESPIIIEATEPENNTDKEK